MRDLAAALSAGQQVEPTIELRVAARAQVTDDIVVLDLARPDGASLPNWQPGAHIDLLLTPSLVRQYSLCGDPGNRTYWRIGVLLDPASRGGSQYVHDRLAQGSDVRVRGPRNAFAMEDADEYLFVAGGIGITPILPMIRQAEDQGVPWRLLYGGRRTSSMAFLDELSRYGSSVSVYPQETHGLIDLGPVRQVPRPRSKIYACGPTPLLGAIESASSHWPVGSLRTERFSAAIDQAGDSFTVDLARSGQVLEVPAGRSIAEVMRTAGIEVLTSCESGICGTCLTPVIDGQPDHKDDILSAAERDAGKSIAICVSRSRTPVLVLDV